MAADSVRDALTRLLASEGFAASPRLQQFLTYIVEEAIAGRSAGVKGKTIAADVYGRDLADGSGLSVVRVEARRLRRLLDEYYADAGVDDPIRIHVDPGGYAPRFERANPAREEAETAASPARRRWILPAVLACALTAAVGIYVLWPEDRPAPAAGMVDRAVREALRKQSIPTLQAANLASEARRLLFPIFDVQRQKLALGMFRHSIDLASDHSDGFAGAAQVLANLALLSRDAADADRLISEADVMADKALVLAPTSAWANAAKGLVFAVKGDTASALERVRLALALDPENGHLLDLVGAAAILADAPDLAAEVSDPERKRTGQGRFAATNIWGVSQLMLDRNRAVIAAFKSAPAAGAPVSAPTLIFAAVAHDRLGEQEAARALVDELRATWPDFPAGFLVDRIFGKSSVIARDIRETLSRHGFVSRDPK